MTEKPVETEEQVSRSYREVLRNRRLAALLIGDLLSQVGMGTVIVAMPIQTLRIHGSLAPAVAVSVVETAPFVLSTVLALALGLGRLRLPSRALLLVDCVLRPVVFFALAVLSATDELTLPVLVGGLLVGSVFRLAGTSSRRLLATGMVDKEDLFAVNGLIGVNSNFAMFVVGPVIGGLLVAVWGPAAALSFDALGSVVLLVVVALWVPAPQQEDAEADAAPAAGWQILRSRPLLARLFVVIFFFNFFYMPVEVALPLLVRGPLDSGSAGLGLAWGAFGAGAFLGALATNYVRRVPERVVLIAIIALWGLCPLALSVAGNLPVAMVVFALGGLVWAPFIPVAFSFIQSELGPDEQQPVVTLWVAGSTLAVPLGLAAGGPVIDAVGSRGGLALSGALTLALIPLAGVGLFAVRRKRSEVPRETAVTTYDVVVDGEEQYSVHDSGRPLPEGWRPEGFSGTEEECRRHIDEVGTALRSPEGAAHTRKETQQ
ncbi:MFS transporter [Streptomyces sp. NPDC050161]|uniref:MFS transporter n=1 Tax=Streptomyces sp. NPDC050161 TaxID=3365604 RepID=UPI0037A5B78A